MKYKVGGILAKFFDKDNKFIMQRQVKVRHFRNRIGNKLTPTGGNTVLFDMDYGAIITTDCHPNDLFNKKVGLEVCIHRWVDMMKNDGRLCESVGGKPKVQTISTGLDEINIHLTA